MTTGISNASKNAYRSITGGCNVIFPNFTPIMITSFFYCSYYFFNPFKHIWRTLPDKKETMKAHDIKSGTLLLSSGDWTRRQTSSPHNFSSLPEGAGSTRTTRSQEQARANRTFKGLEFSLRLTEDRIRGFKGSSASIEYRQLRDSLQHARQAIDPHDNLELTTKPFPTKA